MSEGARARKAARAAAWVSLWAPGGAGLEHVLLDGHAADSVLVAVDEDGQPFRLTYRLRWNEAGAIVAAELACTKGDRPRILSLQADGRGRWRDGAGRARPELDGCLDVDIWPTPLTNSLPIWRSGLQLGERRTFRMAWVSAPDLGVEAKPQAYTRVAERRYRFESLDGSGFTTLLTVDAEALVVDYPDLFRRVGPGFGRCVASPP